MLSSLQLARHDLLFLAAGAWQEIMQQQDQQQDQQQGQQNLALWPANDWPVVVRRQTASAQVQADNWLAVAISLPPRQNGDKPRLALQIRHNDVLRQRPALALLEMLDLLEQNEKFSRRTTATSAVDPHVVRKLSELASAAIDVPLAVYGSWSWQAITALPFVRANSDIDVLFAPRSRRQLAQGLDLLQHFAKTLPLDGEIVFPSGDAVAWREWLQHEAALEQTVLVKTFSKVSLMTRRAVLASLDSAEG